MSGNVQARGECGGTPETQCLVEGGGICGLPPRTLISNLDHHVIGLTVLHITKTRSEIFSILVVLWVHG